MHTTSWIIYINFMNYILINYCYLILINLTSLSVSSSCSTWSTASWWIWWTRWRLTCWIWWTRWRLTCSIISITSWWIWWTRWRLTCSIISIWWSRWWWWRSICINWESWACCDSRHGKPQTNTWFTHCKNCCWSIQLIIPGIIFWIWQTSMFISKIWSSDYKVSLKFACRAICISISQIC